MEVAKEVLSEKHRTIYKVCFILLQLEGCINVTHFLKPGLTFLRYSVIFMLASGYMYTLCVFSTLTKVSFVLSF